MPDEFFNPYHFVPLPDSADNRPDAGAFRDNSFDEYDHAKFHAGHRCGRIVCRMTTKKPIFIGAKREEDPPKVEKKALEQSPKTVKDYTKVEHFIFDGKPAIPPTSIKGMLSAIIEGVTGSAMRVLNDGKPVSYRKQVNKGLSATGVLIKRGDDWTLRPLSLPAMANPDNETVRFSENEALWKKAFANYANMRIYDYTNTAINSTAEFDENGEPESASLVRVYGSKGAPIDDYLADGQLHTTLKSKGSVAQGNATWIAQRIDDDRVNIRAIYRKFRDNVDKRIRGQYNTYIPYPEIGEAHNDPIPVSPKAIEHFKALANERAAANNPDENSTRKRLPYQPLRDTQSNEQADWQDIGSTEKRGVKPYKVPKLRTGQIVFFDIGDNGEGEPQVSEFSFSQIWRDAVRNEDGNELVGIPDFIKDPELVPYHDGRQKITPAERLLGFVDITAKEKAPMDARQHNPPNRAFRGRVRPSIGISENDVKPVTEDETTSERLDGLTRLKILAEPKPPSPALYFTNRDGGNNAIKKDRLNPARHQLQGRKMYLHHGGAVPTPWKTRIPYAHDVRAEQKSAVKLVDEGNEFWFHLDLDDLDQEEIDLLCFALRPSENFLHKIGMGKAIGLGSVKIDVMGLFLVDRCKRYTVDDFTGGQRYHESVEGVRCNDWPARYEREKTALSSSGGNTQEPAACAERFESEGLGQQFPQAITALKTIGEFMQHEDKAVTTPLTQDQLQALISDDDSAQIAENETFKWFADRDKKNGHNQQLKPISNAGIPTLKTS